MNFCILMVSQLRSLGWFCSVRVSAYSHYMNATDTKSLSLLLLLHDSCHVNDSFTLSSFALFSLFLCSSFSYSHSYSFCYVCVCVFFLISIPKNFPRFYKPHHSEKSRTEIRNKEKKKRKKTKKNALKHKFNLNEFAKAVMYNDSKLKLIFQNIM